MEEQERSVMKVKSEERDPHLLAPDHVYQIAQDSYLRETQRRLEWNEPYDMRYWHRKDFRKLSTEICFYALVILNISYSPAFIFHPHEVLMNVLFQGILLFLLTLDIYFILKLHDSSFLIAAKKPGSYFIFTNYLILFFPFFAIQISEWRVSFFDFLGLWYFCIPAFSLNATTFKWGMYKTLKNKSIDPRIFISFGILGNLSIVAIFIVGLLHGLNPPGLVRELVCGLVATFIISSIFILIVLGRVYTKYNDLLELSEHYFFRKERILVTALPYFHLGLMGFIFLVIAGSSA